ncbi:Uncharacterized protein APZ42_007070, partial [Daphnia magna]
MSAASFESSSSGLRQRALFSSANPPRGNSPIDSRVSVPDHDILSILPNSVRGNSRDRDGRPRDGHARNISTQRDRDNRPRDSHARSNSTQRDRGNRPRGSPSRSRSRSIPRSRTRSASRIRSRSRSPNVVAANEKTFNISASKSRQVRKWLVQGLPNSEAKALRLNFKPVFDSSFDLFCPKLDESMERKWLRAMNLPKLKDFQETMLKSIQYQMIDSMRPMLHAWNQMRVDDPLLNSVESYLRLMGSAFANVSKLRRENVIRHVVPSMKPLLKDPRAFSSRECERLFGSKFIDVMVKEVDDDAKLAKIGRDGGPSHSQNGGNSNRRNGGRNQSSYVSRDNQSSGFNKGGKSDKGNPYFRQTAQGANNRYVCSHGFTPPIFLKMSPVQSHVGGRLSKFTDAWLSLFLMINGSCLQSITVMPLTFV